jgi:hypothetical protein
MTRAAAPKLVARKTVEPSATIIDLAGTVNEHAEAALAQVFREVHGVVRVVFRDVPFINSYGLMLLAGHFQRIVRDHTIEFAECPEFVVDQFQMLDFAKYGKIISFYLRYFCERCETEDLRLITTDEDVKRSPDGSLQPPRVACSCSAIMEPVDSLEFLAEHRR